MKNLNSNDQRALVTSILASGLDDLNMMFLSFTLSSIIVDLGISNAAGGMISTITNLGMLIGGIFFGVLADRFNRPKVLRWTVILFSVATGLIFFTPNLSYLYLMRFLSGVGIGGEYGIAISIMAGIVPARKMGKLSSLNGISGQVGSILSAVIASLLGPTLGWRGLFLVGLFPLLLVLYMKLFIDDEKVTNRYFKHKKQKEGISIKALFKTPKLSYQTLILMLMTTIQIAGYFGMMNWLPKMMQTALGISVKDSSTWMIATIVGMSIGMLVFGIILDKLGPRLTYGLFLLSSSICVFLFQYATTATSMLIGGAVVGFFVNGMFSGYGAIISRLYPAEIHAIANNLILNVGRAVGGFSSVIIGFILDISTTNMVMIFLSSLYLLSFLGMMTLPALKRKNYQK